MSKSAADREFDELKIATAAAFAGPVDCWLSLVEGKNAKEAIAALAIFMGHMLAGTAASLGVAHEIEAEGVASVIAGVMAEQIELLPSASTGRTLQ